MRVLPKNYSVSMSPHNPRKTYYFLCVQNHFEDLEMAWDDRYERQYGFFRVFQDASNP